jgi:hypothetical protein
MIPLLGVCALDHGDRRSLPTDDFSLTLLRETAAVRNRARRNVCEMYHASYPNDFGIVDSVDGNLFEPGPPVPFDVVERSTVLLI